MRGEGCVYYAKYCIPVTINQLLGEVDWFASVVIVILLAAQ